MKKNIVSLILFTGLFSGMFYNQFAGINYLIFSVAVIAGFLFTDAAVLRRRDWLIAAFLVLYSATFTFIYGSTLAVWANIISLMLLSAASFHDKAPVILKVINSAYSVLGSVVFFIIKCTVIKQKTSRSLLKVLVIVFPLIFGLMFFFIYKASNPLFRDFTRQINLDFISIPWLFFTLAGFFIAFGFYYYQRIAALDGWVNNLPVRLEPQPATLPRWNEKAAVSVLLILLNGMLLFINILDLKYLYLGDGMPDGITHKEFVHNGVGMLVLSIVMGISLILYFFRGNLSFGKDNRFVRILAIIWIMQNLFMVLSTCLRHNIYVFDALLSYKRIGVYFWLAMSAAGLITACIKIMRQKSTWFLIRTNFALAVFVLIASSAVDWDRLISNFNLGHMQREDISPLDKHYLLNLSETNIAGLYAISNKDGFEVDSLYSARTNYHETNRWLLDRKLFKFLTEYTESGWRSYNLRSDRVYNEIIELDAKGRIPTLDLSRYYDLSLVPLFCLKNIEKLNLSESLSDKKTDLNNFSKLKWLELAGNEIDELDSLAENKNLEYLGLAGNHLSNLSFLRLFPSLQELNLTNNGISCLKTLPKLDNLQSLTLDANPLSDLRQLNNYPKLSVLHLNNMYYTLGRFPELPALKDLEMDYSPAAVKEIFRSMPTLPLLEHLSLRGNKLRRTDFLSVSDKGDGPASATKCPLLKSLVLDDNELIDITGIERHSGLESLSVNNNSIEYISLQVSLSKLKSLKLNNNRIINLIFLNMTPQLSVLEIGSNNSITDFGPLVFLKELTTLNVSGTSFSDLSILSCTSSLKKLDASNCELSLAGLERFKNLEKLSLSYISKEDTEYLKKLPRLKEIRLTATTPQIVQLIRKELRPDIKVISE
jgi:hypothetical protein